MTDLYQILAIGGVFIALFSIFLLIRKQPDKLFIQLLTGWLIALTLNQIYFFISRSPWSESISDYLLLLGYAMPFIHFPLLFLFVRYSLLQKLPWVGWVHFIPWFIFTCGIFLYSVIRPESFYFGDGFLIWNEKVPFLYYQHGRVIAIVAAVYTVWSYVIIRQYKRKLAETHANEAPNIFNWVQNWILLAIAFFILTYLVVEISLSTSWIGIPDTFGIISFFTTVYIIYVSFNGIAVLESFEHIHTESLQAEFIENADSDEEIHNLKDIVKDLKQIMEKNKLFLQPDLNISDLSGAIGLPIGKVSMALNKGACMNFYDFVNSYRADEFKTKVHDVKYAHYTLPGIAMECGFSSKSTFNDFFKRYTGMTPSQYKKMSG
jgi:AraC-like DNA-binding protein